MRRFLYMLIVVVFNMSGLHITRVSQKNIQKNMQLCFNDRPRNFGTTHFIVGYNEKNIPDKNHRQHKVVKQHKSLIDGAAVIDKDRISQSFFTTIHDLSPILLEIMSSTKKRLYLAAFNLTDMRIVDCVIDAHKNGIDVCVITDESNMRHAHSKVHALVTNNVAVWCYKPALNPKYKKNGLSEPLMHHKIIIGDDFVVTGSANLTKAGQKNNIENINILRDRQTIDEHRAEFERLKKYCIKCRPQAAA